VLIERWPVVSDNGDFEAVCQRPFIYEGQDKNSFARIRARAAPLRIEIARITLAIIYPCVSWWQT
jgi:hypothetical protein